MKTFLDSGVLLSAWRGKEAAAAAFDLACRHGLSAADALNMTAALRQGADEFVTSEGANKALFRVPGIRVQTIRQAAGI